MAHSIPTVREGSLQQQSAEDTSTNTIEIGTAAWYSWLEQHHAFTFETSRTTYTARKEQRPGGWYWYAYRRIRGKLHSFYLGKSADLTFERLHATAAVFERAGETSASRTSQLQRVSRDQAVKTQPTSLLTFPTTSAVVERLSGPEPALTRRLPVQLTPLIGRQQDAASAVALLRRPEVRLLTLTGVLATWDIRSEKSERCAKNITKERPSRAGSMSHLPKKKEDLIAAGPSCFAASSVRKAKS